MKLHFPRDGSAATPPHPGADFLWKDYGPHAFRRLRRTFAIDAAQYLQSICGARRAPGAVFSSLMAAAPRPAPRSRLAAASHARCEVRSAGAKAGAARAGDQALRELPSPGKSGSVFFLSHDDKYIIKTVRKARTRGAAVLHTAGPLLMGAHLPASFKWRSLGTLGRPGAPLPRAGPACPRTCRRASGRRLLQGPVVSHPWMCLPYGFCHARCTYSAVGRARRRPAAPPRAQGEVKLLLELLPRYTGHVLKHPHTLLIKFFGLYRVTPANGAKACSPPPPRAARPFPPAPRSFCSD